MPVMVVGDTILVSIVGNLCGQRTINTFPYRVSAVDAGIFMEDAFPLLNTLFYTTPNVGFQYRGVIPQNMVITQTWWQTIRPQRYRKSTFATNQNGNWGADALTANTQASITRVGEQANRRNVGGIRIPIANSVSTHDQGLVTPALKSVLNSLAVAMAQPLNTNGAPNISLDPLATLSANGAQIPVYECFAQDQVRVLRRRTVGLGI